MLPGVFQDVRISQNETVQAVASRIPGDVAFVTLQFHTQYHNATLSYNRVSYIIAGGDTLQKKANEKANNFEGLIIGMLVFMPNRQN